MVHIPVFGVDVKEPRILHLLPQTVDLVVKLCARIVNVAVHAVHPLSKEEHEQLAKMQRDAFPREFDRVIQKAKDKELENDDQVSSEAEEAGYHYYRRMLRTSIVGASDEEEEDVLLRKMGRFGPSAREQVAQEYFEEHPLMDPEQEMDVKAYLLELPVESDAAREARANAAAEAAAARARAAEAAAEAGEGKGVGGEKGIQEAATAARMQELEAPRWQRKEFEELQQRVQAMEGWEAQQNKARQRQAAELARLQKQARSPLAQSTHTVVRASLGLGLGLGVAKGIGLGVQQVVRAIRARRRKAKAARGGRPSGPQAPKSGAQRAPQQQQQQQQQQRASRPTTRKR